MSVLDGPGDAPSAGCTVRLVSHTGDVVTLAELASWDSGPHGLTATGRLITDPRTAEVLDGHRVWASLYTERTDALLVLQGVVRRTRASHPEQLELTGVLGIAREPRRSAPRALLSRPVRLNVDGSSEPVEVVTVDLSSSGCRVQLPQGCVLRVGSSAVVEIDLGMSTPVRAEAEVVRLDEDRLQAVLRFRSLSPRDESALNRSVYPLLASPAAI